MTTLMTNSPLPRVLRALCCIGALTGCSAWATLATWQSGQGGNIVAPKSIVQSGFGNLPRGDSRAGIDVSNQLSFTSAPESGATSETSTIKAAALNDKLQARDTDFEQAPPSTLSSVQSQSTMQAVGSFDSHFASVPNYQFVSTASALGGAPARATSSAGGDPVPVPEMSALFPIVGLIVAVSCTRILRRRRATQLSSYRRLV
jgi:hypothetical protein